MKVRQEGQGSKDEQTLTDFREELLREEQALLKKRRGAYIDDME